MTTYSQRSELEQQAQGWNKKAKIWDAAKFICELAIGLLGLGLLISAYLGV